MKNSLILLHAILLLFLSTQHRIAAADAPLHQQNWSLPKLVPDDTSLSIFFDDFSSGYQNHWVGNLSSFVVMDNRLCITQTAIAPIYTAIRSARLKNTVWEVGLQIDGPFSKSNYVRLYLATTSSIISDPQQGYHLEIDGNDDDHVYRLWRQNGTSRSILFQSTGIANRENGYRARVRVICTIDGDWKVLVDEYDSGSFEVIPNNNGKSSVKDGTILTAAFAGYQANFSPTRWNDFKLDYFLIKSFDPTLDSEADQKLLPKDILINEILTNPKPGGVDFIEIVNSTNKIIDLSHMDIASVNADGKVAPRRSISNQPLFIHPEEFIVLTTKPDLIKQHYPDGYHQSFIEVPNLPNFNNETGGVVLYYHETTIDSFFYTPAMQSTFTISPKGVSLERQAFSVPTNTPGNFRSAATLSGGATPGYPNSRGNMEMAGENVYLVSKTFSPDNDGIEDQLEINYRLPESGFMINIDIFTGKGRLIKRLHRNQSMALQGKITWDGMPDANHRLPVGIYIAVIEIYNDAGLRKVFRRSFVLASRL